MPESALTTLKTLLGIPDDSRDALLTTIVSAVQARLLLLLGGASEVPESLAYMCRRWRSSAITASAPRE